MEDETCDLLREAVDELPDKHRSDSLDAAMESACQTVMTDGGGQRGRIFYRMSIPERMGRKLESPGERYEKRGEVWKYIRGAGGTSFSQIPNGSDELNDIQIPELDLHPAGQNLGLELVAEGEMTRESFDHIREIGEGIADRVFDGELNDRGPEPAISVEI
jgi:hypothetical protein